MRDDEHYRRFRDDHARGLDDQYRQWRAQNADARFDDFRRSRDPLGQRDPVAPEHEGAMRSLGRAVSETVTGTRTPDLSERIKPQPYADDDDRDEAEGEARGEKTSRFFERS